MLRAFVYASGQHYIKGDWIISPHRDELPQEYVRHNETNEA